MRPSTDIASFSAFTVELHERSLTSDPVALFQWSQEKLTRSVGADCSWGGWVDLSGDEVDVCASIGYLLPSDFEHFWADMKHEDLLARDVMTTKSYFAAYDRQGDRHTDGMIALSDRYHLDKMAVVTADLQDRPVCLYLSTYRSGRASRNIGPSEANFLRCALDHLRFLTLQRPPAGAPEAACLLVNREGRILSASAQALQFISWHWRGWKPGFLPAELNCEQSPEHVRRLLDLGIAFSRRELGRGWGAPVYGLILRKANSYDHLTARERQIADEIANGRTHKEIAKMLVISPATVRNHTQTILMKLGVHNKAALAKIIHAVHPA
jgi:DNA-binding CsgD family transcriptional regulator